MLYLPARFPLFFNFHLKAVIQYLLNLSHVGITAVGLFWVTYRDETDKKHAGVVGFLHFVNR